MANDLNQCQFIGRLGKDPEVRFLPNGGQMVSFSLACGSSWTDKQAGQKQDKTEWVPVVMFGKLAEIAGQYLKKGAKVFVSGNFKTRKWQDKSGQDRYTTEIVVDGFSGVMQMLDSRNDGQQGQAQQQNYQQPAQQAQQYQQPQPGPQQMAQQQRQPAPGMNQNGTQQSPYANNPMPQQGAPGADGWNSDITF